MHILFFFLSVGLTLFFFIYGFNHYYLLRASRHYSIPPLPRFSDELPAVAVHLPIYNEKYVVQRLVDACVKMARRYGKDRVNILILDDSTDDTVDEAKRIAAEYTAQGFQVKVLHRDNRQGFKAGALQYALERTPQEFIAIFDADFIPDEDFLSRTIPYFVQNERLGIVQSRWCHINRNFNALTFAIAIAIDIHFGIEQTARYASGLFQNFNGSGGVLRKSAIVDSGGWQADTLTEDLDLSYRMQLRDYKILYIRDLDSPGEIPPTVPSFKQQQGRWANGSLRTARKILPSILRKEKLSFNKRLQAFIHLTGYLIHPLMTFSFILACIGTFFGLYYSSVSAASAIIPNTGILTTNSALGLFSLQKATWIMLGPLIILCTIAPWISSIKIMRSEKNSFFRNLGGFFVLLLLGFGLSISNSLEIAKGLLTNRTWEFTRTPKYANLENKTGWQARKYQTARHPVWMIEFAFALVGILAIAFAINRSYLGVLLILVPFTIAYLFISFQTIRQSRPRRD